MPLESFKYKSGASGSVSVPSNAAVKKIAASGGAGATAKIGDGDNISVELPFSEYPKFSLVGPIDILFTNTTNYYVSWVEYS